MDLTPILYAAIRATGGNPDAVEYDASDLERAQKGIRAVDAKISAALGYIEVASIRISTDEGEAE